MRDSVYPRIRVPRFRLHAVCSCLVLVACTGVPSELWESLNAGEVMYRMDWSDRFHAGVPFVTASGFEVTLERAELNHWVIQLTPCESDNENEQVWRLPNITGVAWAGHSVGDEDLETSQFLGPMREDLLVPMSEPISIRTVGSVAYCHAYWSVASVVGPSDDVVPSLLLEGTWRDLDNGSTGEIRIASTINWGLQLPLVESAMGLELASSRTVVSWFRDGPASFEDVDFHQDHEDAIAREVLRRLVGGVRVSLERVGVE